jgi:hypothetical protein
MQKLRSKHWEEDFDGIVKFLCDSIQFRTGLNNLPYKVEINSYCSEDFFDGKEFAKSIRLVNSESDSNIVEIIFNTKGNIESISIEKDFDCELDVHE